MPSTKKGIEMEENNLSEDWLKEARDENDPYIDTDGECL